MMLFATSSPATRLALAQALATDPPIATAPVELLAAALLWIVLLGGMLTPALVAAARLMRPVIPWFAWLALSLAIKDAFKRALRWIISIATGTA